MGTRYTKTMRLLFSPILLNDTIQSKKNIVMFEKKFVSQRNLQSSSHFLNKETNIIFVIKAEITMFKTNTNKIFKTVLIHV